MSLRQFNYSSSHGYSDLEEILEAGNRSKIGHFAPQRGFRPVSQVPNPSYYCWKRGNGTISGSGRGSDCVTRRVSGACIHQAVPVQGGKGAGLKLERCWARQTKSLSVCGGSTEIILGRGNCRGGGQGWEESSRRGTIRSLRWTRAWV